MCLVLFSWRTTPGHRLLLAGNRDEVYARPSTGLGWWPGYQVLAGRDLEAGGSWMAVTRNGRFALVTNVRDPGQPRPTAALSRGLLVAAFCSSPLSPAQFAEALTDSGARYAAFNLLLSDGDTLVCHSNRYGTQEVGPGIHGLSNASLDEPWPKVRNGTDALGAAHGMDDDALLRMLADETPAADAALPDTGVGIEWERRLSSLFIRSDSYGTRASSVLRMREDDGISFTERGFTSDGRATMTHTERFTIEAGIRA